MAPVNLREFKRLVKAEFGPNLENVTPSNVREFLDKLQMQWPSQKSRGRFVIDEPALSYEEILRDFFARVLDMPEEQAVISLWTLALELAFADLHELLEDRLGALFRGVEEPPPDGGPPVS